MTAKSDWEIHYAANGVCSGCGEMERNFIPYTCNAHTHGMEKYGHKDFQLVLKTYPAEISRILSTFVLWVQSGRRFKAGDMVSGVFQDCNVRLDEFEETGRTVLRIIIPDDENRFPEDEGCMEVYRLQLLETDELWRKDGAVS